MQGQRLDVLHDWWSSQAVRGHLIWKLPCSSTCTCTAHCSPTVQHCSYKVPYPNVYADPAKNEHADAFNRVQVGHLQWCWLLLLLLITKCRLAP